MKTIKVFKQMGPGYCGPACVQMILEYFGVEKDQKTLALDLGCTPATGTNPEVLVWHLTEYGFDVSAGNDKAWDFLETTDELLTLVLYRKGGEGHYSLVGGKDANHIAVADPETGFPDIFAYERTDFEKNWWDTSIDNQHWYGRWAAQIKRR